MPLLNAIRIACIVGLMNLDAVVIVTTLKCTVLSHIVHHVDVQSLVYAGNGGSTGHKDKEKLEARVTVTQKYKEKEENQERQKEKME